RARDDGRYVIVDFEDDQNTLSLDGDPELDVSAWRIPPAGIVRCTSSASPAIYAWRGRPSDPPPATWGDLRVETRLRAADLVGRAGLIVRHQEGSDHGYRFLLDFAQRRVRLEVEIENGTRSLPSQSALLAADRWHHLAVELEGERLTAWLDGSLAFTWTTRTLARGGVGLFVERASEVDFLELRVTRPFDGQAVYRFGLTTSRFAHFRHQIHDFQGVPDTMELEGPLSASPHSVPRARRALTRAEASDWLERARELIGTVAFHRPEHLEVTRLRRAGRTVALLVRGPEAIDWRRVETVLEAADRAVSASSAAPAGAVKLIAAEGRRVDLAVRSAPAPPAMKIELRETGGEDWLPWAELDEPEPLAEGLVVCITRPEDAGQDRADFVHRAITELPALPAAGFELRLRAGREVIHRRIFLPVAAYRQIGHRLLRNADRTACFVFPNEPLADQALRLRFTWSRRLQLEADRLTLAGDDAPEVAELEIS
ncbi:MAG: hypothetical protein AAF560_01770, partial [Acidobacteriota bacterium]